MWTPRRISLFLLGVAGFVAAYVVYARALGPIDGLPALPAEYLPSPSDAVPDPPPTPVSTTMVKLIDAFGRDSPEVIDEAYKLRLMRDNGLAFACGQPSPNAAPSRFVTVSPFSVAMFAKPKPPHLRLPGEVDEISTFHADKAILEFDKEGRTVQEIMSKGKLVGMELISVPDLLSRDDRRGRVWVTNNQRSADPGQFLVFRTPGPMYYRAPDQAAPRPDAPQIWTSAAVEVVDKRNLPRPLRSTNTTTAVATEDALRVPGAVASILLGSTLPPPTVTADGMKIYLQSDDPKAGGKKGGTGYSGVRLIELSENVRFCQWSDGGTPGFMSAPADKPDGPARPGPLADPPAAAGAVFGGLGDGAAVARQFEAKSLLVIETPGWFRYDFQASVAQFEAAAVAKEAVANHVAVARVSASDKQDSLFCRKLVVEFFGEADQPKKGPSSAKAAAPAASPQEGMRIKALTATGEHVYIAVEAEQLVARGTQLRYTTNPAARSSLTVLDGMPVTAIREKNLLEAGNAATAGRILIASTDPDPAVKADKKKSSITVPGLGQIHVYDEATKERTLQARWDRSLTHEKVTIGGADQDLLKFDGNGYFEDKKGNMKLSGDLLKLWLAAPGGSGSVLASSPKPAGGGGQALPSQLQAIGHVRSDSPDLIIDNADLLTVWFKDVPPPAAPEVPKPAAPAAVATVPPPVTPGATPLLPAPATAPPVAGQPGAVAAAPPAPAKAPEPEKPKPPVHLAARVIESWMRRYPVKAAPPGTVAAADPAKPDAAAAPGQKYELDRALCEDRVVVHQDPADPAKNPNGLDVSGIKLNVAGYGKAGSVMTVTGTRQDLGQVHFEGMALYGPVVVIDQPQNAASVDGFGVLVMPGQSEPAAAGAATAPPDRPTEMVIQFTTSMNFEGAKSRAQFLGSVQAVQQPTKDALKPRPEPAPVPRGQTVALLQGPRPGVLAPPPAPAKPAEEETWSRKKVNCHRLDVTFDRPVYFNDYRKANDPAPVAKAGQAKAEKAGSAKLETAECVPMPDDEAAKFPAGQIPKTVVYLEETFTLAGKLARAQWVRAPQISVQSNDREQKVFASGEGEVRILQPGSKEGFAPPSAAQSAPPAAGGAAKPDEQEMKLTYVKYLTRMVAEEKGKTFQKATFTNGARVWHVPTDKLYLNFPEYAPPKGTMTLTCTDSLEVSTDRAKPDAPPQQWLRAVGNAEFKNDEYLGNGHVVTYEGTKVVLDGRRESLAHLWQQQRGPGRESGWNARQIQYYKNGFVSSFDTGPGTIFSGQ